MKEYEKLLRLEDERKNNLKAKKMVKLGLFEMETVDSFNFEEAQIITYNNKKFKGVYDLYEMHDGSLVYVNAKTEDDNSTSAYAYDLIKIDDITKEEYEEILKASTKESFLFIRIMRITLIVMVVLTFASMIYQFINSLTSGATFNDAFFGLSLLFAFFGFEVGIYIVAEISYRKYFLE